MSTNLSAKYYQENKKRLQTKKAHEGYQIFLKKKRKKSKNMVVDKTKICQKMQKLN